MRKKLLIAAGTLISVATPFLTVVSCGFNDLAGEIKIGNSIHKIDSEGRVEIPSAQKSLVFQAIVDQILENNKETTFSSISIINAENGNKVRLNSTASDGQYIIYNSNSAEKMSPISLNITIK